MFDDDLDLILDADGDGVEARDAGGVFLDVREGRSTKRKQHEPILRVRVVFV